MHCLLSTAHCTLYIVIVHCKLSTLHCTLYTAHGTVYCIVCTLYTVQCTLHIVHLYTVQCMYLVHCTLYNVHTTHYCIRHSLQTMSTNQHMQLVLMKREEQLLPAPAHRHTATPLAHKVARRATDLLHRRRSEVVRLGSSGTRNCRNVSLVLAFAHS